MSPLDKHSSTRARGIRAPFHRESGTALDVTLRACDRNVPDPVYRLALIAYRTLHRSRQHAPTRPPPGGHTDTRHERARPLPDPPPGPRPKVHSATPGRATNVVTRRTSWRIYGFTPLPPPPSPPPFPPSLRPGDAHPQIKLLPARVAG